MLVGASVSLLLPAHQTSIAKPATHQPKPTNATKQSNYTHALHECNHTWFNFLSLKFFLNKGIPLLKWDNNMISSQRLTLHAYAWHVNTQAEMKNNHNKIHYVFPRFISYCEHPFPFIYWKASLWQVYPREPRPWYLLSCSYEFQWKLCVALAPRVRGFIM